jgi:hypothetical protein
MKTRTIDNRNRPAQPEPGEDPAVEKAPRRAEAGPKKKPARR